VAVAKMPNMFTNNIVDPMRCGANELELFAGHISDVNPIRCGNCAKTEKSTSQCLGGA
jgi:hypothetical protein